MAQRATGNIENKENFHLAYIVSPVVAIFILTLPSILPHLPIV